MPEIVYMKDVHAIFYFKDNTVFECNGLIKDL